MSTALTEKKIRYDWLDVIKAFAMLLVILGHLCLRFVKDYQVYASFIKLPLFFAASGFVFNPEKAKDIKGFISGKTKRILLPYFYLCTVICVFNLFLEKQDFLTWLKASAYTVFTGSIYMWFLPVLFLCNILMLLVFKVFKNKPLPIIISAFAFLIAGYFLLPSKHIFFNVNETLIAFSFCIFGYYFKTNIMHLKKKTLIIIGSIALAVFISVPIIYQSVTKSLIYINMNDNYYSSFVLDMVIAFCGTLGIFAFAQYIKMPKFVVWFGQNTMFYYAFHIPVFALLVVLVDTVVSYSFTVEGYLKYHILPYILLTALTVLILTPLCMLTNKYLPFLVGMKKIKSKKE